ncbi:MAG: peptidase inhibitor I78 [Sphingobium sp.]|nr:peptidase inhibitor I78 [Sphingobium sp.]
MRPIVAIILATCPLAGCTTAETASTPPPVQAQAQCNDGKLDQFVGQKASADLGATMLTASGAKTLRWGPPRSAMTMDFRADRLTVAYDDALTIVSARCG